MAGSLAAADDIPGRLEELSDGTGAVLDKFNDIIRLPFVDALKVDELGDVSVGAYIQELKTKYQALQNDTVPFARDLYGYASLQEQTIPLLMNGSLSMTDYIRMNKSIIRRKRNGATALKQKSAAYRKEFTLAVDILTEAVSNLTKQIRDLEVEIEKREEEYDEAKMAAIFTGILFAVFTAAAVFSIGIAFQAVAAKATGTVVAGTGFLAATGTTVAHAGATSGMIGVSGGLSIAAVSSFSAMIVQSVTAGNLLGIIETLKDMKSSAETTRENVVSVLEKMSGIEDALDGIVSVWTEVETNLDFILGDIELWESNGVDNDSAEASEKSWTAVKDAVQKYTEIVSAPRSLSVQARGLQDDAAPPAEKALPEGIRRMAAADFLESVMAPSLSIDGGLDDFKRALRNIALIETAMGRVKMDEQSVISKHLHFVTGTGEQLQKELRRAASELEGVSRTYSALYGRLAEQDSPNVSAKLLRENMDPQVDHLSRRREEADKLLKDTEQLAFNFQGELGQLLNVAIRSEREKKAELQATKDALRNLKRDRNRRKILSFIPIAGAINNVVDLINKTQQKINRLSREARTMSQIALSLRRAHAGLKGALSQTTVVAQTFSSILNQNDELKALLDLIDVLQTETPAAIFTEAALSWEQLGEEVSDFLG